MLTKADIEFLKRKIEYLEIKAAGSHHSLPRGVKPPPPPTFNGKRGAVDSYLFLMEEHLDFIQITDDEQRVRFAGQTLEDDAATWYRYVRSKETRAEDQVHTWEQFKEGLRLNFQPLNSTRKARDKLATAAQRNRDTVAAYTAYMRSLFMEIPGISEDEKLDRYVRGLQPHLRKEVEVKEPVDFEAAANLAEAFDSAWRQIGYRPSLSRFEPRSRGSRNGPQPMELGSTDLRRGQGSYRGGRGGGRGYSQQRREFKKPDNSRFTKLTEAEREQYRKENRCTYCRKTGHSLDECPTRPQNQGNGRGRSGR